MIVTDDNEALTAKRAADAPRQDEDQALPAYSVDTGPSTSSAAAKSSVQFPSGGSGRPPTMPYYSHGYDGHLAARDLETVRYGKRSAMRRFLKAFCVAILVYLLFGVFVQSVVELAKSAKHRVSWPGDHREKGQPRAEDGTLVKCVDGDDWSPSPIPFGSNDDPSPPGGGLNWQIPDSNPSPTVSANWPFPSPPYLAYASFSLPSSADLLYFLSRGQTYGSVQVAVDASSEKGEDGDNDVTVNIIASYYTSEALDKVSVCQLKRKDRRGGGWGHGVGVYASQWPNPGYRDRVRFDITVLLPVSSSPLLIKSLQTDFSNFAHQLGDLERGVVFEKLDLRTTNSNINAGSLFAKSAVIRSSNGPITGSYNTSSSLKLITSNAHITAQVALHSADKNGDGVTELEMKTSNGALTVPITLFTSSSSPNYTITASTSNNPLKLSVAYPSPPPRAPSISLNARTSNGPASVQLGAAYEGAFDIRTSNSRAEVDEGRGVVDPFGDGRRRTVSFKTLPGPRARWVTGSVWWGKGSEDRLNRGKVEVQTSNSPVSLRLY